MQRCPAFSLHFSRISLVAVHILSQEFLFDNPPKFYNFSKVQCQLPKAANFNVGCQRQKINQNSGSLLANTTNDIILTPVNYQNFAQRILSLVVTWYESLAFSIKYPKFPHIIIICTILWGETENE